MMKSSTDYQASASAMRLRPSQGRHAVISYKFFSQYAPLHPSGLLGPVVLSSGE